MALEIANLFAIRTMNQTGNPLAAFRASGLVWASVAVVVLAQAAVTQLVPMQAVFGTQAISLADLAVVLGISATFFVLLEVEKWLRHLRGR